jgi:uncharacterized RDD family membrane protein YckC
VSDTTPALAGHGRRIAAALLDGVAGGVVFFASGAAGFAAGLAGAGTTDNADDGWEELGWIVFGTLGGLVIGAVCWLALVVWLVRRPGARNGQTIGKQLVSIRAVRVDGAPLGVGTALLREILAKGVLVAATSSLVSGVLGFVDGGAIGMAVAVALWYGPALADDRRRALHDRMLGTRVVVATAAVAAPPAADELWPATS